MTSRIKQCSPSPEILLYTALYFDSTVIYYVFLVWNYVHFDTQFSVADRPGGGERECSYRSCYTLLT